MTQKQGGEGPGNEGEGSRSAAKQYNKAGEAFAKSGRVEPAAKAAKASLEGGEAAELARAEQAGKARAKPRRSS